MYNIPIRRFRLLHETKGITVSLDIAQRYYFEHHDFNINKFRKNKRKYI